MLVSFERKADSGAVVHNPEQATSEKKLKKAAWKNIWICVDVAFRLTIFV